MVDVETMRDRVMDFGGAMSAVLDELADLRREVGSLRVENGELRKRLMPSGMRWPRYDTGELVEIGDEVASSDDDGSPMTVNSVKLSGSMFKLLDCYNCEITDGWTDSDERVRRPEPPTTPSQECRDTVAPDSWEMLARDADTLIPVVYCSKRHLHKTSSGPVADMANDIVRRAKALATGPDVVRPGEVV